MERTERQNGKETGKGLSEKLKRTKSNGNE